MLPVPLGTTIAAGQTGKSAHDTSGRDLADGVVVRIGDEDVADAVDGHSDRTIKTRGAAGAIGAARAAGQTGEGGHDTGGRDFADSAVNRCRRHRYCLHYRAPRRRDY